MTLRIGLIGCGAIARRTHLPALRRLGPDTADVVAFASRSRASAEAAAAEWGSGKVVDDWPALLDRPDVDAVDICCPNSLHAEIAIAAASAGKHVLVEKPMAVSVSEADAMIRAAETVGVVLSVAHNLRYAPAYITAGELVRRGDLGRIVGFRAAFGHSGPRDWAPNADWFFDPRLSGGGALIDLGIHVADLLRFVLDDDVSDVAAMLRWMDSGVEEAAQVVLHMTSGAIGSLHASWAARPAPDRQLSLFGTEATLHVPSLTEVELHRVSGESELVELSPTRGNPYRAFVEACLGERGTEVSAWDGRAALAVIEAAYRSGRTREFTHVA